MLELSDARILPPRMFGGLRDTLRVLLDVARGTDVPLVGADVLRKIERQIEDLDHAPATLERGRRLAVATDDRRRRTDRRCRQTMRSSPGGRAPTSGPATIIRPICCTWLRGSRCLRRPTDFGSAAPASRSSD